MTAVQVLDTLRTAYPHASYYLHFENPLQLVVAAILSAQCRDEVVNATTRKLFAKYRTATDFAGLRDNDITAITFFKNKAKYIRETARIIDTQHHGRVPRTVDELVALPGIGRKTAHAILQNGFGIVHGVIVDTHVIRVAYRLGWTENKDPKKIEEDLMNIFPKPRWREIPWLLKDHGRAVCVTVPKCSVCVVERFCKKQGVTRRA